MKVAIYGAGGILGQTMRLYQKPIETRYYRRSPDLLNHGVDLTDWPTEIGDYGADIVVNLAGENRPDHVERLPAAQHEINVLVPWRLSRWCDALGKHYVHVSTQGVFGGASPPYSAGSDPSPVNAYGRQKAAAESCVRQQERWTILRPTFVLGVRPMPHVGRQNPFEQMMERPTGEQVNDRWFSPLFAREAAEAIWRVVLDPPARQTIHLGTPARVSRWEIARLAGLSPKAVSHDFFIGFAPRPADTSYGPDCWAKRDLTEGLGECLLDWYGYRDLSRRRRAQELSLFLGIPEVAAAERLGRGFHEAHHEIGEEFRVADPQTDDELLEWYRTTDGYLWELSAYHADPGFNYAGMCAGVVDRLKNDGGNVLCLGDGIGDLTLALRRAGIPAVYHDLKGSQTARFAQFRFWLHTGKIGDCLLSKGWAPNLEAFDRSFDTVACFDFLEHVTDVPAWMLAIHRVLRPGGVALFQNAFNMGSGRDGSIPMHLARNDRYEKDWTSLAQRLGFAQQGTSNWWEKAA